MRAILAAAILFLCLSRAAQEPEYPTPLPGSFATGGERSFASLVDIESARARSDREAVATPIAVSLVEESPAEATTHITPAVAAQTTPVPAAQTSPEPATQTPPAAAAQTAPAPAAQTAPASAAQPDPAPAVSTNTSTKRPPNAREAKTAPVVPLDQLCGAVFTSAQDNNLPVAFFANLIWQESRLRDNAVSPKGALGIAQFMPKVAVASGLQNPFDPMQALAASARLLRALRDQFGNLGFVAAAYNAGSKRVSEWLAHGRTLPRETRGYVLDVTGHSVEQWQKKPVGSGNLHFVRRLPCRDLPEFAELEQAQQQQAQQQQAQPQQQDAQQTKAQESKPQQQKPAEKPEVAAQAAPAARLRLIRVAERKRPREEHRYERVRIAERDRGRHEAKVRIRRGVHERHLRA
jgi:soluble lytic murein transglycosylase-like protein